MIIQHNLPSNNANRMLSVTTGDQAKAAEKLSSGYKVNRAADDAAGLAISEKMRKQIKGLTRGTINAQDGISAVQTAEGALNEVHDMLQRLNELAIQAANGTNSLSDRESIQDEIEELCVEIDRVSETTKFNETELLKGASGTRTKYLKGHDAGIKGIFVDGVSLASLKVDISAGKTIVVGGQKYNIIDSSVGHKDIKGNLSSFFAKDSIQHLQNLIDLTEGWGGSVTINGTVYTQPLDESGQVKKNIWVSGDGAEYITDQLKSKIKDGTEVTVTYGKAEAKKAIVQDIIENDGLIYDWGGTDYSYWQNEMWIDGREYYGYFETDDDGKRIGSMIIYENSDWGKLGYDYYGWEEEGWRSSQEVTENDILTKITGDSRISLAGIDITESITGIARDYTDKNNITSFEAYEMIKKALRQANNIGADPDKMSDVDYLWLFKNYYYSYDPDEEPTQEELRRQREMYDRDYYENQVLTNGVVPKNVSTESIYYNRDPFEGFAFGIKKGISTVSNTLKFDLHVGSEADMTNKIMVEIKGMSCADLGIKGLNVVDDSGIAATYAIDAISDALQTVSAQRAYLGAIQNRLEHTIANLDNVVENTTAAESRIRDTDMAEEMVEYSKNTILQQAGQSMLAQANQATSGVLSLLQ